MREKTVMRSRSSPSHLLSGIAYQVRRRLGGPVISGPVSRVRVSPTAGLGNVLINTACGYVDIGDYVFFGHDVLLLTGTHNFRARGVERQAIPQANRNIVIENGVWIASRAVIVGPCTVGENSVIGCGCIVDFDVPADTIVRLQQEVIKEEIRYPGAARGR